MTRARFLKLLAALPLLGWLSRVDGPVPHDGGAPAVGIHGTSANELWHRANRYLADYPNAALNLDDDAYKIALTWADPPTHTRTISSGWVRLS